MLTGRKILLGVSGGIAAYKSAYLIRALREQGADVQVVMTEAAQAFITPLTLQSLSGKPVRTRLLDGDEEAAMDHIALARWADAVLIAPATANLLAKIALGLADDLLTTLVAASDQPLWLAPAMNLQMWANPALVQRLAELRNRGATILGPAEGEQACGEQGLGRMLEPDDIVAALNQHFMPGVLHGKKVLVTAGPTREAIDPVRYISNRSSGKMGYALAQAARDLGATVTLVSGPVGLQTPAGVERVDVISADEMHCAVEAEIGNGQDILLMAAAVADYRPVDRQQQKIKKQHQETQLSLAPTVDIVRSVCQKPNPPYVLAFAAETEHVVDYARKKMQDKGVDMIAANDVSRPDCGFDVDENALHVIWNEGERVLTKANKHEIAQQLLDIAVEQYQKKRG